MVKFMLLNIVVTGLIMIGLEIAHTLYMVMTYQESELFG